mgnify:FL=1
MSVWRELIKLGVKSAGKAMVKKGDTVSTNKIEDGIVQFVEPFSKKVTVQSKDGKIRETVRSGEVTVKKDPETGRKIKRKTSPKSIYIADKADAVALKDLPDDVKLNMSEGELLQKIIRSGESDPGAARRLFPTDSPGDKRGRFIAYSKTKIKPDLEERAYKKNIFAREQELAKQEVAEAKRVKELEEKKVVQKKQRDAEEIKKRRQAPQANDPVFKGDFQKFLAARRRYEENSVKPALKNDPNATFWKRGGSVNTKKKQYKTITNRFSDRMLPNKKRTTRIY